MTDILIVTSARYSSAALDLTARFQDAGASTNLLLSHSSQHSIIDAAGSANTIAAILDEEDTDQMLCIAFLCGRNKDLLLLDPGTRSQPVLFGPLKKIPLDRNASTGVLQYLRRSEPELGVIPQDAIGFLDWAAQHRDHLGSLSASQFERLISVLLWHAGMAQEKHTSDSGADLSSVLANEFRVHVECKRFAPASQVDLHVVLDAIHHALEKNCEAVVLATNSVLTQSAEAFIRTSVPPVWHLDLDTIQSLVERLVAAEGHSLSSGPTQLICPAWKRDWHHEATRSLLDRICVPGDHDAPADLTSLKEHLASHLFSQSEVPRLPLFVFFSTRMAADADLSKTVRKILRKVAEAGTPVWHNSKFLSFGRLFSELEDYSTAIREAAAFWIFDDSSCEQSYDDLKSLNWLASEFVKYGHMKPTVVTDHLCRTRLRLPQCFADSTFVDASEWLRAVPSLIRPRTVANEALDSGSSVPVPSVAQPRESARGQTARDRVEVLLRVIAPLRSGRMSSVQLWAQQNLPLLSDTEFSQFLSNVEDRVPVGQAHRSATVETILSELEKLLRSTVGQKLLNY
jgi:hypothetical protein